MRAILNICLALVLTSCGNQPGPDEANVEIAEMSTESRRLRSEVSFHDSIAIGPLVHRTIPRTIESSGRIALPPNAMHTLHSSSGGYVSNFNLIPGDAVSRGTLLFTVTHPNIVEKQRLFLETTAERELAQKDFARKQELIKSNATSAVAFEEASARAKVLEARYRGLRAELDLWGIDADALIENGELQSTIRITAPVRGIIDEVYVHPGQMVSPDDPLVSIVNRSNLHLELQVLARFASSIKSGQKVSFSLPGSQDRYMAKVIKVNPLLDSDTETLNVHADPEERALSKLIPGMFVRAQVELDSASITGLPEDAIVQQEGVYYAYGLDDQYIEKIPLTSVQKVGDMMVFDSIPFREFVIKGAYYME